MLNVAVLKEIDRSSVQIGCNSEKIFADASRRIRAAWSNSNVGEACVKRLRQSPRLEVWAPFWILRPRWSVEFCEKLSVAAVVSSCAIRRAVCFWTLDQK